MKNVIFILFAILYSAHLYAGERKQSPLQYSIKDTIVDNNLKSNEAVFVFTFEDENIKKNSMQVEYSIDGKSAFVNTDSKGTFEVKTKPGKHIFQILLSDKYAEIYTDSIAIASRNRIEIDLFLQLNIELRICEKPVIYLYPQHETDVKVEVVPNGKMTFTYPEYKDSWIVNAKPNGEITMDKNTYNYLFWEAEIGNPDAIISQTGGFIVEGKNASQFLEEQLTAFGFSSKEKADFITFWGPALAKSKRNRVQFVMNENCDHFATLNITPQPDNIARFYILFEPIDDSFSGILIPQIIAPMNREGFTVLEWGGSKISFEKNLN